MPFSIQQFKILSEKTLLFFIVLKKDGTILDFNPRSELLFPESKCLIKGTNLEGYIANKEGFKFKKLLSSLSSCEHIEDTSLSLSFPLGQKTPIILKINFELYDDVIRAIGMDITKESLSNQALSITSESKKRLQAMVNNGFAYMLLLNTDGEILMTDKKSLSIIKRDFNVDPTLQTCRFIDVMPINFKNSFAHEFNEALKGNHVKKEIERITNKGNIQWLEAQYTPIFDQETIIDSVLVSFHDITEQKLAEIAIKESHIKEQELNNLKSNILSNFSHEIRTPLNGIMTLSKLIVDEQNQEEKIMLLRYLEESKNRLLDTINNLSNLSEVEAMKKNINLLKHDVNFTVETSFREYKHMAEAKNLSYNLVLDTTSPYIKIDNGLFKTALNNIIHNSIKYTNTGGIIVKVYSKKSKNNVYISVTDTGIGINRENLNRIFEPFIQESIGFSRKYEGTGIGLSLSKRYIEILDGEITVESKVGIGTEFCIIIPEWV
ncbi:PAS domain-containing sensor histidine kinase [Aquimarina sp. 2201CG1-2-11]|uniref:sensor histidine kinase n=1 Tax=Aquimarina discodermiae TaxID=3231043 RepID=UPI003462D941